MSSPNYEFSPFQTLPPQPLVVLSSPISSCLDDISRTAPLEPLAASPDSSHSPASAPIDRLDRLSGLVGLRGMTNPFFHLPSFLEATRRHFLALTRLFSDDVLTELLEKFFDIFYLHHYSSTCDHSLSHISSSSSMVEFPSIIISPEIISPLEFIPTHVEQIGELVPQIGVSVIPVLNCADCNDQLISIPNLLIDPIITTNKVPTSLQYATILTINMQPNLEDSNHLRMVSYSPIPLRKANYSQMVSYTSIVPNESVSLYTLIRQTFGNNAVTCTNNTHNMDGIYNVCMFDTLAALMLPPPQPPPS